MSRLCRRKIVLVQYSILLDSAFRIWYNQHRTEGEGTTDMKPCIAVPEQYEDIRAQIRRRQNAVFVRCSLWCAAVLLLEYFYLWRYFAERINITASALIAMVLFAIYPLKKGIVRIITDRGWQGTVRDVKKKSYIHFRNLWARSYSGMTTRMEGHVYMHSPKKRHPFLEKRFPIRHKFILQNTSAELPYQTGDFLRRYRGCQYPVIVYRTGEDGYPPRVCVFCGKTENDRARERCDFCGFSLITPKETVQYVEYGMQSDGIYGKKL